MIEHQSLLVTIASAPSGTLAFVDIGGNGVDLIPVTSCEIKDGRIVISASKAKVEDTNPPESPKEPPPVLTKAQAKKAEKEAKAKEAAEASADTPPAESLDEEPAFDADETGTADVDPTSPSA